MAGKDSITVLTLNVETPAPAPAVVKVGYTATIETGQTYLFGCRLLTEAGEYKDTLHMAGKDSITVLTLNVETPAPTPALVKVGYIATIETGQTYLFGCRLLTEAGEYKDTLHMAGKDSITVLTLNVETPTPTPTVVKVQYDTEIQVEETYLFGCKTYRFTEPGLQTLTDTLHLADKDSIVIVNLTVSAGDAPVTENVTVAYTAEIKQGEIYLFGCRQLKVEDIYTDTLTRVTGGDSIIHLTLTVCSDDTVYMTTSVIYCGTSYHWEVDGQDYTASGKYYYDNGPVAAGSSCHHYTELNLTLLTPAYSTVEVVDCDSAVYNGVAYYASTTFDEVISGGAANGCDSIVTVKITVNHASASEDTQIICGSSYDWNGQTYTTSGDYTYRTTNAAGCDSVVTLHLTINPSYDIVVTDPIVRCGEYVWTEADTTIITSGTYSHVFATAEGCDSLVTLTVTIDAPKYMELPAVAKYNNRLLVLDRATINSMPGWENVLDSLYNANNDTITWYRITGATPDPDKDEVVGHGYYYHNDDLTTLTGKYYATVLLRAEDGGNCDYIGRTVILDCGVAESAPAPILIPTLARPGEDIKVLNLDPLNQTVIRIYTADGILQRTMTVSNTEAYTLKAGYDQGFYLVEVVSDGIKSTLRYIVK